MAQRDDFDKIFVICPTEDINSFYSNPKTGFVPKNHCFPSYDEEWIKQLLTTMTELNRNKKESDKQHILLILDDIVANGSILHTSDIFRTLVMRGRHIGIALVISAQNPHSIPPYARQNADFIFLGQLSQAGMQQCCDEYCSHIMTKKQFIQMYQENTKNYYFLVCNNQSKSSNNINDFYGKIKTPDDFVRAEQEALNGDDLI